LEIRGISAVSILGARIYVRDAQSSVPGTKRFNAPRGSDGIVEDKAPRQIVDVIDLHTTEARHATEVQRRQDAQHQVLRPEPGAGRGTFLDITV